MAHNNALLCDVCKLTLPRSVCFVQVRHESLCTSQSQARAVPRHAASVISRDRYVRHAHTWQMIAIYASYRRSAIHTRSGWMPMLYPMKDLRLKI